MTRAEAQILSEVRSIGEASAKDIAVLRGPNPQRTACGIGQSMNRLRQNGLLRVVGRDDRAPVYRCTLKEG